MSSTVSTEVVRDYVAAVRVALDDLPPEELDELTGGLEADLDDAINDDGSGSTPDAAWLARRFGSPSDYAAELRSAAGLPPRAEVRGQHGAGERMVSRVSSIRNSVTSQSWWPSVADFLTTIRPAWWVLRGAMGATVINRIVFRSFWMWLLLFVAGAIVSVWLGKSWVARRTVGLRFWSWLANACTVVVLLASGALGMFIYATGLDRYAQTIVETQAVPPSNGVWLNGAEVRNILVYDAQGRPLRDVQLTDESGNRLEVGDSARQPIRMGNLWVEQVPGISTEGRQMWNVFPLRQKDVEYVDGDGVPLPSAPPGAQPLQTAPHLPSPVDTSRVDKVFVPSAVASASPSASASGAASTSPSAGAGASATASPAAG